MTTISNKFDKTILPRWAQNDPQVVLGCKLSLSFRCDVFSANTKQYRDLLKREAKRFEEPMTASDPFKALEALRRGGND